VDTQNIIIRVATPEDKKYAKIITDEMESSAKARGAFSLWAIARAGLPHGAGDATVARAAAELHALNRRTIGPDPDLIRPGQHLVFPSPSTLSEEP